MQTIYQHIKQDHDKVKQLFGQLEETEDPRQCEQLFQQLKQEVLAHAKAEEQTFYSAMMENDLKEQAQHSKQEHQEVESLMQQLESMEPAEKEWRNLVKKLRQELEHHMQEEENEIFPKAQKVIEGEAAETLAEDMEELEQEYKQEQGASSNASASGKQSASQSSNGSKS